jgi:hypothetical protein
LDSSAFGDLPKKLRFVLTEGFYEKKKSSFLERSLQKNYVFLKAPRARSLLIPNLIIWLGKEGKGGFVSRFFGQLRFFRFFVEKRAEREQGGTGACQKNRRFLFLLSCPFPNEASFGGF